MTNVERVMNGAKEDQSVKDDSELVGVPKLYWVLSQIGRAHV